MVEARILFRLYESESATFPRSEVRRIAEPGAPGSHVVVRDPKRDRLEAAMVLATLDDGGRLLSTRSGVAEAAPDDVQVLPLIPEVAPGDRVLHDDVVEGWNESTVDCINEASGRVYMADDAAGVAFGLITTEAPTL